MTTLSNTFASLLGMTTAGIGFTPPSTTSPESLSQYLFWSADLGSSFFAAFNDAQGIVSRSLSGSLPDERFRVQFGVQAPNHWGSCTMRPLISAGAGASIGRVYAGATALQIAATVAASSAPDMPGWHHRSNRRLLPVADKAEQILRRSVLPAWRHLILQPADHFLIYFEYPLIVPALPV